MATLRNIQLAQEMHTSVESRRVANVVNIPYRVRHHRRGCVQRICEKENYRQAGRRTASHLPPGSNIRRINHR